MSLEKDVDSEDLLSLSDVAEMLRVSTRHLLDLRKDSSFPQPVRLGIRRVAFRRTDIVRFINSGGLA